MITKPWFVIHHDGVISMHGSSEGMSIFPGKGLSVSEFDTESEMTAYISDNNLELPEVENDSI